MGTITSVRRKEKDIEFVRIKTVLEYIKDIQFYKAPSFSIYAAGFTYLGKNDVYKLEHTLPVEIDYYSSTRKGLLGLLPIPCSKFFLVKINDVSCTYELFSSLGINLLFGLFMFSNSYKTEFLNETRKLHIRGCDAILNEDDEHFYYVVDADNLESSTGVREYFSRGNKALNGLDFLFF